MKTLSLMLSCALLVGVLAGSSERALQAQSGAGVPVILTRDQASAIMPATVFYRGKTASVQGRNSAGLRLAGDRLVLVAAVDTSGYSSSIQESYQDYLITEVPLRVGGKTLAPGAYGVGFIAGDQFVVLDVGAHELFKVSSVRDAGLARPNPLQMLADAAGGFRLYSGRSYVTLAPDLK
jgi:hypothetical protein